MAPSQNVNICSVKPPQEAFELIAKKGVDTVKASNAYVFTQSFWAGCYIGFGALVAATISGNIPGAVNATFDATGAVTSAGNPGLQSFVFAGLFPVNLLLIILSGGILITGTAAAAPAAVFEGKISVVDCARVLAISWLGNMLGSLLFAGFTEGCDLLVGGTKAFAIKTMEKKVAKDFFTTFLKGIGCNWMVCMAVFLSTQAQDMGGKYVGIWFPISTFVMCGFEHIPANFYLLFIGLISGKDGASDVTVGDVIVKNFIPVTLGNIVGGAGGVALGYSFMYGRLGKLAAEKSGMYPAKKEMEPVAAKDVEAGPAGPGLTRVVSETHVDGI